MMMLLSIQSHLPSPRERAGKTAREYLRKKDDRAVYLDRATQNFHTLTNTKRKGKKKNKKSHQPSEEAERGEKVKSTDSPKESSKHTDDDASVDPSESSNPDASTCALTYVPCSHTVCNTAGGFLHLPPSDDRLIELTFV